MVLETVFLKFTILPCFSGLCSTIIHVFAFFMVIYLFNNLFYKLFAMTGFCSFHWWYRLG